MVVSIAVDFIFVRLLFCCRKSFCNLTNNQTSNWQVLLGTFFFFSTSAFQKMQHNKMPSKDLFS